MYITDNKNDKKQNYLHKIYIFFLSQEMSENVLLLFFTLNYLTFHSFYLQRPYICLFYIKIAYSMILNQLQFFTVYGKIIKNNSIFTVFFSVKMTYIFYSVQIK